jgi:sugar O-acyltransferase (sialic acid O-acetyltransferase NeuD family)
LTPVLVWGARGHCKVLAEFLPALGHRIVAVFDNDPSVPPPLPGLPVFQHLEEFDAPPGTMAVVAIGGSFGRDRLDIHERLGRAGFPPLTVVHPAAYVATTATMGEAAQVLAGAVVGAEARIGRACIVNTRASIDHECVLGDGVHVAPGATLAGNVEVGDFTLVAVGAVVLPRIRIGRDCIVGAGAVVTRDVPDGTVVYGNPARIIR